MQGTSQLAMTSVSVNDELTVSVGCHQSGWSLQDLLQMVRHGQLVDSADKVFVFVFLKLRGDWDSQFQKVLNDSSLHITQTEDQKRPT